MNRVRYFAVFQPPQRQRAAVNGAWSNAPRCPPAVANWFPSSGDRQRPADSIRHPAYSTDRLAAGICRLVDCRRPAAAAVRLVYVAYRGGALCLYTRALDLPPRGGRSSAREIGHDVMASTCAHMCVCVCTFARSSVFLATLFAAILGPKNSVVALVEEKIRDSG